MIVTDVTPLYGDASWNEPDGALLDLLARHGALAAAMPVINASGQTGAQLTRTGVRAALRALLANGLITAVPKDSWPEYLVLDPPGGH